MLFQYEVFIWKLSMIVIFHVFVSEDKKSLFRCDTEEVFPQRPWIKICAVLSEELSVVMDG